MPMNAYTKRELSLLKELVQNRKKGLTKVMVGIAIEMEHQQKPGPRICCLFFRFLGQGEEIPRERFYDYGNFRIARLITSLGEALEKIEMILDKELIKVPTIGDVQFRCSLSPPMFANKRTRRVTSFQCLWPSIIFSRNISHEGSIPRSSIQRIGLPLYPSGDVAIVDIFGLSYRSPDRNLTKMEIVLPDTRARIKSLTIGSSLTLEVELGTASEEDLLVKFHVSSETRQYVSEDLKLKEGIAKFQTEEDPVRIEAHIVSSIAGETIDKWQHNLQNPWIVEGVLVEETQLLDLISRGENARVEFKRELNGQKPREFLETIVAFANAQGGVIIIGVTDTCEIQGWKEDVEGTILNLIAEHCDPPIEVDILSESALEKPIMVVRVPEGPNKPYLLKGRGVMIRRGSSDRLMTRVELDAVYNEKRTSNPYIERW